MIQKTLDEGLHTLVDEKKIITGISLSFGDLSRVETRMRGNGREVQRLGGAFVPAVEPLTTRSIFDLASVTKLFTCVSLMQLIERGRLDFDDEIPRWEPRFTHLKGVTVYSLMAFQTALSSDGRVDAAKTREEALDTLFTLRRAPQPERRYYTDMGAMALKYVIEAASGMRFFDYVKENILLPLGMNDSFACVPEDMLAHTVCYNYERRIVDGKCWLDTGCEKGVAHDPKARILDSAHDLCGHAGLFSTLPDMTRFAQGLLSGALVSRKTLMSMGENRTGAPLPDGGYTQYLGLLCFSKHPDQTYSEVPRCFGDHTIALNGFAGNHISVDPEQDRFMVILSNRIHNRITMATGRANPHEQFDTLPWDDGKRYVVSQNYVYCKDENIKDPIGRLFQTFSRP